LLPEAEWRLWCFQAFHPGEADPWQTSAAGFALHSGFVRSPHLGDTIVAHAGKVPVNQSFSTGPETPHCEFRFTPSGWTLRKVEVFRR
ncbi:MAG TPA: hypothetical protein VNT75_20495, partial [Symbiobacteriaceae bacterium]|nr:hypothetical protein [Symbiobacteriaceae bacterium]